MFPQEYAAAEAHIARSYGRTHDADAALMELGRFANEIKTEHFSEIAEAPDADLHAIAQAKIAWLSQLERADPVVCYQLAEGVPPDPARVAQLLHIRRDPGADIGVRQLSALRDARAKPTPHGPETRNDAAVIVQMYLKLGGSVGYLKQIAYGNGVSLPPLARCKNGILYAKAIEAAPADVAVRHLANDYRHVGHGK